MCIAVVWRKGGIGQDFSSMWVAVGLGKSAWLATVHSFGYIKVKD